MNRIHITWKRLFLYGMGLFILSSGVSISIIAALGVSPVSSLPYAFSLSAGISIGVATVIANVLFIIVQAFFKRRIEFREFILQLLISFIFGFFMDATLFLAKFLPMPEMLAVKFIYFFISCFVVSGGLCCYIVSKLPLMPYDALTAAISEQFKLEFGKAKIISDLINVCVSVILCFIFIHSLGSVGVGTIIAAYLLGKILGGYIKLFKSRLEHWLGDDLGNDEGAIQKNEAKNNCLEN